ncbi:MAG: RluA family pseudouridine synthase [Chlamydiae bacterium]|nr:RluA family pseudouridine synthase [Chlamydiota bacterium]
MDKSTKKNSSTELLLRLQEEFPDSSKNTLKSWIQDKRVVIKENGKIELLPRRRFIHEKLEVLYEDKDLIVVDKASGLLTVATETETVYTAHAMLKKYLKPVRPHPVHRLDRDTSGVLVFSKNPATTEYLKEEFFHHRIQRQYLALVDGDPPSQGTWENYIYEDRNLVMQITDNPKEGKLAITHFERIGIFANCPLLRVRLETGRKNQIRLQAKNAGCPIVGDTKYRAFKNPLGRLGLHAELLGFVHPTTKENLLFSSRIPFPILKK